MTEGEAAATTVQRLSLATLPTVRDSPAVTGPAIDPATLTIGIVHFGIGAFHRAHQAVFTEDAAAARGETHWGILGVTGRSDAAVKQLRPQDCLFSVLTSADEPQLRLVASVRDVAWPAEESARVADVLARSTTHIATLTITEKGYRRAASGDIDTTLAEVREDAQAIAAELRGGPVEQASRTPIGLLVRGLARRFRDSGEPFTVVCCDNMLSNGQVTRQLVHSLVAFAVTSGDAPERADDFRRWLKRNVTFPSTMVDRLVPATTEDDSRAAAGMLGLRDEALAVAEPFAQWVIEDDFAGQRPAWESAGAVLTDNVEPYEQAKLRVLNAAHSVFAYLGLLAGHETIAAAVACAPLRHVVREMLTTDVLPTLRPAAGLDLPAYRDEVLTRFANPALAHQTRKVAMDGSLKMPLRFVSTVRANLSAGRMPQGVALAFAAWFTFIARSAEPNGPVLDDPLAHQLHSAIDRADALRSEPDAAVQRLLSVAAVFPEDLAESVELRAAIVGQLERVRSLTAEAVSS